MSLYNLVLQYGWLFPIVLWDKMAKKERTFTGYDQFTDLFTTTEYVAFHSTDLNFSATREDAEEKTEWHYPTPPTTEPSQHKCTCEIVALMQRGCECKGI